MLVDTHDHLYHSRFDTDREEVIQRAHEAGVEIIIMPAIDLPSIEAALDLCERYPGLYAMAAIHPSDVKDASPADFEEVVRYCRSKKVIAVGESGLDYYWDRSFDEKQQEFFRMHIRLAAETDLPLIIHNRDAGPDVVRILQEERALLPDPTRLRGIFHCFGGPPELGRDALDLGFYLGIGGTLTFKNSGVADAVRDLPMDRIVIETDAPFLAPVPHRGKRNEPAYVRLVAEKLAEVKETTVEEIAQVTTANARRLFALP